MENLEKIELIREKTGVTYEEAKQALEASEYDTLEAIVYLERLGKIKENKSATYSTGANTSEEFKSAQREYETNSKTAGDILNSFLAWCGKVVKKGCETTFEVTRYNNRIISVPLIVLVVCLVLAFWVTLPLLIIGLFFDCKYRFIGVEKTEIDLNGMCEKASQTCENIKDDIKNK